MGNHVHQCNQDKAVTNVDTGIVSKHRKVSPSLSSASICAIKSIV